KFDVADVETEISDDQCDMLMDVDEDPSMLDSLLDDMRKKEAQAEKRKEQLRKNAKKAAAKRKPAAKKKAASSKKPPKAAAVVVEAEVEPETVADEEPAKPSDPEENVAVAVIVAPE